MSTTINRRNFFQGVAGAASLALLAGCSTEQPVAEAESPDDTEAEATETATKSPEECKVAVILISSASQVTAAQGNSIQAHCDELGAICSVQYYEQDVSAAASMVENAITSGADILFFQAQSGTDCATELQKAHDAGICVVLYGTKVEGADYSYFCGEDGHNAGMQIGEVAAQWANENLVANGEPVIAALGTYSISPELAVTRYEGAREAIEAAIEDITIVDPPFEAAYKEEGLAAGENLLQSNPDVNLVVGVNDQSTIGVYEAFMAGGKEGQNVGMFGIDGTAEAMALIAQDTMFKETLAIDPSAISCEMMDVAFDIMAGNEPAEKDTHWDGILISADNVADYKDQWESLVE